MMLFAEAAPSKTVREPTNLLHIDDREFILFVFWKSGTVVGLIGSMLIVMLIGIFYEAISAFRLYMLRNNESALLLQNDEICPSSRGSNNSSKIGFIK